MKKRANNEGSIAFETALGLYRAAVRTPDKRVVKRFKKKSDAQAWVKQMIADIDQGRYVPKSDYTIGDWLHEYIAVYCEPNLRPKSVLSYYSTAMHAEPIAKIKLQDMTPHSAQLFINDLPRSMAASSRLKLYRLLKAAVQKAKLLGLIRDNFMDPVAAPKLVKERQVEIFTQEEIKLILDRCQSCRIYPIIVLAIATGCRMGELLGLRVEDIHPDYIDIKRSVSEVLGVPMETPPKTAAGLRKVTISPGVRALIPTAGKDATAYVFTTRNGTPYRTTNIGKYWHNALQLAGVPYRNFHCLRHTHATQLLAAGVPLLEVTKRLGHAKASHTLNLYGHAVPGLDSQIPSKVTQIFGI